MKLLDLIRREEYSKRLREVVGTLKHYCLDDWLGYIPLQSLRDLIEGTEARAMRDKPLPERLRLALTDLGPTYIKFGQVLSTRSDLVGPDVAEELRKLQSDTPADPPDSVEQLIVNELGQCAENLFAQFDPVAFSSASIGQVHRAKLEDGRDVVVKVQHAGIEEKINIDLELLQVLAKLLQEHVADARPYQPISTAREFQKTLLRELDFTSERRNMEQFARNFAEDDTVYIPAVHQHLCSQRVLTMDFMAGIPGSKPQKIQASGVALDVFARKAATIFLNMIFRDGFYHADPHPGNYMLLEGGVLGLLDCGMVGRLDEPMRELFAELLLMLIEGDSEGLADLLLRAGSAPEDVDRVTFRTDVSDLIIEHGTRSLDEFDLGGALEQLTSIIRHHQVLMPSAASLLIKTLVMLEGTSRQLNPSFSLAEILEPFKDQLVRERLDPKRWLKGVSHSIRDIDRLAKQGPRNLAEILERLQSGKLKIRHELEDIKVTANRLVAGMLIASLFMGSSMLLSQQLPPVIKGISLIGAIGCLTAVILGGKLLWSIREEMS